MTDYSSRTDARPGIHTPPHGPVLQEFDAKQGRRGYHILTVLLTSLALVVIAFAALYLYSARPFVAHNPVAPNAAPTQSPSTPPTTP